MATPGNLLIENNTPYVMANGGTRTLKPVYIDSDLTVTGTTTIAGVTLTDLTTTGNTVLGNAVTDTLTITGATSITSTSASALAVGANGATTPVLKIDASTASQAAGLSITGAASTSGVAIAAIGGAAEPLTLDAKGTGTIGIGTISTGAVTITPATTVTGVLTATAGITSPAGVVWKSGTAVPATAGAIAAGAPITCFSSGWKLWVTSDAPTHSATKGDLCINTGGSSSSTRLYVNNGTTTWIAITTAS